MEMIGVRCPRCDSIYEVPAEKAGHRGRCPQCGGIMRVPAPEAHPQKPHAQSPWRTRLVIIVPVGLLLILATIILLMGRGRDSAVNAPPSPQEVAAVDKLLAVEQDISKLAEIDHRLKTYDDLWSVERRQHAREILGKIKEYAPVSQEEYALRAAVVEAQSDPKQNPTGADWQLDTTLTGTEKTEYGRNAAELAQAARGIQQLLDRVGIAVELKADPFGRRLIDRAEVQAKLTQRREDLEARRKSAEAEVRQTRRR